MNQQVEHQLGFLRRHVESLERILDGAKTTDQWASAAKSLDQARRTIAFFERTEPKPSERSLRE